MRVLVTGGAGFIGRELVELLLESDCQVCVIDDFRNASRGELSSLADRIRLEEIDIRSDRLGGIVRSWRPHSVVHLAAYISAPESVQEEPLCLSINVDGTRNLLASLPANVPVVFASSAAVYGNSEPDCIESEAQFDKDPSNRAFSSPYGRSKAIGEHLVLTRGNGTVLRFFNVYGPGQNGVVKYPAVLPAYKQATENNRLILIFGDGGQTRDFVHVSDVASVCKAFVQKPEPGVWNVGTGRPRSIQSLAEMVRAAYPDCSITYEAERPGDLRHCVARVDALQEQIGWVPEDRLMEYIQHW